MFNPSILKSMLCKLYLAMFVKQREREIERCGTKVHVSNFDFLIRVDPV